MSARLVIAGVAPLLSSSGHTLRNSVLILNTMRVIWQDLMLYQSRIPVSIFPCRVVLAAFWIATCLLAAPLLGDETSKTIDLDVTATDTCFSPYCCSDNWLYARVDYLYWWTRGADLPPLITTSPPGTNLRDAGVQGTPGATVLYGDSRTSSGPRSGLHWATGIKLDDAGRWWLMTDWLVMESLSDGFQAASMGTPILARPFFDTAINAPNSELISYPGLLAGEVSVGVSNDLWGAAATLQRNLICCDLGGTKSGYRLDFLLGYRYLQLSDDVRIHERLTTTSPQGPLLVGTVFDVTDAYRSRSYFNGLELGLRGELARSRYFISAEARIALGSSYHRLMVDGNTTVSVPGQAPISYRGGLLAMGSGLGEQTDREFAVVPQAEIRVGRQLTEHIRCSIGCSFLYWSQVVRAGAHINTTINSSQIPTPGSPPAATQPLTLHSSSYWGQGLMAGIEWEY